MRIVETAAGLITYELEKKRVKNLNLRLSAGRVRLSVPNRCPLGEADRFIADRAGWIYANLRKLEEQQAADLPPAPPAQVCEELLHSALARAYPLVEPLGVAKPALKLRAMRTQWGNCHWAQGYITLNTALARCPERLREYVALHELVHFLHHNHGPDFYARMTRLMPDWQSRRKELRDYAGALTFSREKK